METTNTKPGMTRKILYWFFTAWMSLGMVSTAIVQLLKMDDELATISKLGYPAYLLTIIGIWKILGVIAVLVPGFLLLKEWAYAGFFFVMSGALLSHLIMADPFKDTFPSALLLMLTLISWYLRPEHRRLVPIKN